MQTSLKRRERRRRSGSGKPPVRGAAVRNIAIAVPLLLFAALISVGVAGFVTVVAGYQYFSQDLPDPKDVFSNLTFSQETHVYDRTGKIQLATWAREKRDVVSFDEISPELVDATTSAEDKTFWDNAGFDPIGIARAGLDTVSGNGGGASTITQQLVRNRLLPAQFMDRSITPAWQRKIREIIQSIRLTQEFPGQDGKQQILTAYLNDNYYGNQSYGVAAAARGYWNIKDLNKLTLAQAALLAGIPKSPSSYDLMRNAVEQNGKLVVPPDTKIVQRRNLILDLMKTASVLTKGKYTDADYEAAKASPVILTPPPDQRALAPQFTLQARHQLGVILCGEASADSCDKVDTGGYTVITSLDWTMQKVAERWVQAGARAPNSSSLRAALKALKIPQHQWITNMLGKGVGNGALATIDYRTGQVYAYVGSAVSSTGYYTAKGSKKFQPQFDVLENGWRQPGSAFKPIVYSTGIDNKTLTAASLFMDVSTEFAPGYTPGNADPFEHGPVRLREALMTSINIPAIKAGMEVGNQLIWQKALQYGIRWPTSTFQGGPSMAIGTLDLHLIDLVSAYGAIANGGVLMPRTTIVEVRDANGTKVWPAPTTKNTGTRVISAGTAYVMTSMLSANTDPAQNPFWGQRAIYDNGKRRPATLKTGTTNGEKDLTAVGYLAPPADPKKPALVTGAWMGNSDNSAPPNGTMSLQTAASMWQDYMGMISKGSPITDFKAPSGVVQATVDAYSGMLPGPYTTKTVQEWFVTGTVPKQKDNTKVGVKVDAASNKLWSDTNGCKGPAVTKPFLDLSKVEAKWEAKWSSWAKADNAWIARAQRGVGVRGPTGMVTSYFFGNGWYPFGSTWGATSVAPTATCPPYTPPPSPTPPPSGSPPPLPSPSGP